MKKNGWSQPLEQSTLDSLLSVLLTITHTWQEGTANEVEKEETALQSAARVRTELGTSRGRGLGFIQLLSSQCWHEDFLKNEHEKEWRK